MLAQLALMNHFVIHSPTQHIVIYKTPNRCSVIDLEFSNLATIRVWNPNMVRLALLGVNLMKKIFIVLWYTNNDLAREIQQKIQWQIKEIKQWKKGNTM